MAKDQQEEPVTPSFEETDQPQKSSVSLITKDVKAAGLQVKPTISNFYRLISNHYIDTLRMNEMTGKPEWWNNRKKKWLE